MNRPPLKKLYYSISEVSELTGVEPHVLRFWEKEFSTLRPRRGRSGNRTYKDRDIEIVKEIRVLLWDEKYTIQGAGERLRQKKEDASTDTAPQKELPLTFTNEKVLAELRESLVELKALVNGEGVSHPE